MNMNKTKFIALLLCNLILFAKCEKNTQNSLTVYPSNITFAAEGGTDTLNIETDANSWKIFSSSAGWLNISSNYGKTKKATVILSVTTQTSIPRYDTLKVSAGDAEPVYVYVSQLASDISYTISANNSNINFSSENDSSLITISTDAPKWTITSDANWISFSQDTGLKGSTNVYVRTDWNNQTSVRSAIINISADKATSFQINVTQEAAIYPSYNINPIAPDPTGMNSTAKEIATKIKVGWNLGNSLEAIGGETSWGNPKTSQEIINMVKESGFNAIRIPCSFNQYMADSKTAELNSDWLARVKEVIQYCINNDMYVILNIHWDGGWLENNCTLNQKKETNAKQKAFWEQIATYLRDFDEHLLFASANEPNVNDATQMSVLASYHQTFINAIRSTGGKNKYRVLVIQGPSTDIEKTNNLMNTLPNDPTPDKLMVEIHYYTPWNFCGLTEDASWGKMFYYWGKDYHSTTDPERNATWGEEETVDNMFKLMKTKFVDKGIPVVLGEFSATRRSSLTGDALSLHLASRAYFSKYVTKQAKANGLIPFYWDNGATVNGCAIFNRNNLTVFEPETLQAIMQGAE